MLPLSFRLYAVLVTMAEKGVSFRTADHQYVEARLDISRILSKTTAHEVGTPCNQPLVDDVASVA